MQALDFAVQMALLVFVGFLAGKLKIVSKDFAKSLSAFIYNFVFPSIAVNSLAIGFDRKEFLSGLQMMLICTGSMLAMLLLANLCNKLLRKDDNFSKIFRFGLIFPNYTYMAFPIIESLYGLQGLFYATLYTVPMRIAFYGFGPFIFKTKSKNEPQKATTLSLKKERITQLKKILLSPPIIGVVVGLILYLGQIPLATPLHKTVQSVASVGTPMGMALCGLMVSELPMKHLLDEKRVYLLAFLRLFIAPALVFLALQLFGVQGLQLKVSVMFSALPVAASMTVFAVNFDCAPHHAAASMLVSTALSTITLPIWSMILNVWG